MKKTIALIISIFLFCNAFSQRWEKLYGTPGYHECSANIIECKDKGYFISGYDDHRKSNWLIKTDINGEMLWEKHIKWDNSKVYPGYIDQNKKGEIIAAGAIALDNSSNYWASIVKLDSCGKKQWCRVFDSGNRPDGYFSGALFLDNGNILALEFVNETLTSNENIYLYCLNPDGKLLWKRPYASKINHPLMDWADGQKLYKFGSDFIITGLCYYAYPENPNHWYLHPLFVGIDSLFNEKWVIPFGVGDSILGKAYGVIPLNDSVYLGIGTRRLIENNALVNNSLLMFLNKKGEELGYRQILNEKVGPDIKSNFISDIQRINNGLFLAVSNYGKKYVENPFGEFVIDSDAHIFYKDTIPNTVGDPRVVITSDSNFLIINTIQQPVTYKQDILLQKVNDTLGSSPFNLGTFVYDSLCNEIPAYEEIDISDCMVMVGIEDTPTPEQYYASLKTIPIKVFPNPAKENVKFELENTALHQNIWLRCYDVLGKLMYNGPVIQGQRGASIDISSWPSGMYVALVYSNGEAAGKCKFVVEGN